MNTNNKMYIKNEDDHWTCPCGNDNMDQGFAPCDKYGHYQEPLFDSSWPGLFACQKCGNIIDQNSLEIIDRNPRAFFYWQYLERE